ncbi:MAG: hypothetical protein U0L05_07680 [Schaedlerella sp.]|nr:hypothetical protein [Schaedlerella sp.]
MPVINISNGRIEEIFSEQRNTYVTITYRRPGSGRREQTVRLVAGPRTVILNEKGMPITASALRVGMMVNASFSSAMTRSIPPQAVAYVIRIVRRPIQEQTTTGRILNIDRDRKNFTTISDRDASTIIRFNVPENVRIFNRSGRPVDFENLTRGMRVLVKHANFMTASIPPQTTAFEIRVL